MLDLETNEQPHVSSGGRAADLGLDSTNWTARVDKPEVDGVGRWWRSLEKARG